MLLPPLSEEEFQALKEDIRQNGIIHPVVVDENGVIIDGAHRTRIANELGMDCPVKVVCGLSEDEKLEMSLRINLARRQLSKEEKRSLAVELRKRGWTQERIAQCVGVARTTVQSWLEGVEEPLPEYVEGKHRYPTTRKQVSTSLRKLRKTLELIHEQPPETNTTHTQLASAVSQSKLVTVVGEGGEVEPTFAVFTPPTPLARTKLDVPTGGVIFRADATLKYDDVAEFAYYNTEHEGFALVIVPKHILLPQVIESFGFFFRLQHVFVSLHGTRENGNIVQLWTPILYFVKEEHRCLATVRDVIPYRAEEAVYLIAESLTTPDDILLVVPADENILRNSKQRASIGVQVTEEQE